MNSLNPSLEKVTEYGPNGTEGASYKPVASVVVLWTTPVARFLMEIATPGITPPEESVTVPRISPLWRLWPAAKPTESTIASSVIPAIRKPPTEGAGMFIVFHLSSIPTGDPTQRNTVARYKVNLALLRF
jgi:hypothetical protein